MKPLLLLALMALGLSNNAYTQCDPNEQWLTFEPTLPSNIQHAIFADVYNDELYVLTRTYNNTPPQEYEILKLDTLSNTWDSITAFNAHCIMYSFKVYGSELFIGGSICEINGDPTHNNFARYDGTQWEAVPEFASMSNGGGVLDMEIYNGDLFITGDFRDSIINYNGIARYDGTSLNPLGLGLETPGIVGPGGKNLEKHDGKLFVSGHFEQTVQVNNDNIAAWDGTNWIDIPTVPAPNGVTWSGEIISLDSCLVAGSTGAVAFGVPDNIQRFQNGQWLGMGTFNQLVTSFARVNGKLYASSGTLNENSTSEYLNGLWIDKPSNKYWMNGHILSYDDKLFQTAANYSCGNDLDRLAFLCDTTICGVIEGRVYVDDNLNCVDDMESAVPVPIVNINPTNQNILVDSTGYYKKLVLEGTYTVAVQTPQWYSPYCPTSSQNVTIVGNSTGTADFSLEATPYIQDLQVTATATIARIGEPTTIYLTARNLGTIPLDASIAIEHSGLINYDSASVTLTSTGTNQFQWDVGVLPPYQSQTAQLHFSTPVNIALLGQIFETTFNGTINGGVDADLTNNVDTTKQIIVAAYDPNKKTVSPVGDTTNGNLGLIPASTNEFEYTIYFQNTGLDTAFNVVLIDTLISLLDVSTFSFLSSSHPVQTSIHGSNMLKFTFANILLPDSTTNLLGSQGFVKFKIKPAAPLSPGDLIYNKAEIYFDYNPPIVTNFAFNTVSGASSIVENTEDAAQILAFPNPFTTSITFQIKGVKQQAETTLHLYNLSGKLLNTINFDGESSVNLQRNGLSSGFYVVNVISDGILIGTEKIILE